MQIQIQLEKKGALDTRNGTIVLAAQRLLQEGRVNEACDELRKIERRVAAHPAVVQLRRNLVAALFGWEPEDNALNRMVANSNVNGNGHAEKNEELKPRFEVPA
jgi:hypothetical protein